MMSVVRRDGHLNAMHHAFALKIFFVSATRLRAKGRCSMMAADRCSFFRRVASALLYYNASPASRTAEAE